MTTQTHIAINVKNRELLYAFPGLKSGCDVSFIAPIHVAKSTYPNIQK